MADKSVNEAAAKLAEDAKSLAEQAGEVARQAGELANLVAKDAGGEQAAQVAAKAAETAGQGEAVAQAAGQSDVVAQATDMAMQAAGSGQFSFLALFTIFVLACFVGFYVVWSVTPALHSPLMAVTNAISSVIIVGGLVAAGPAGFDFSKVMGFLAVALASVNIFGGFIVTQRMLAMYKKKR